MTAFTVLVEARGMDHELRSEEMRGGHEGSAAMGMWASGVQLGRVGIWRPSPNRHPRLTSDDGGRVFDSSLTLSLSSKPLIRDGRPCPTLQCTPRRAPNPQSRAPELLDPTSPPSLVGEVGTTPRRPRRGLCDHVRRDLPLQRGGACRKGQARSSRRKEERS